MYVIGYVSIFNASAYRFSKPILPAICAARLGESSPSIGVNSRTGSAYVPLGPALAPKSISEVDFERLNATPHKCLCSR